MSPLCASQPPYISSPEKQTRAFCRVKLFFPSSNHLFLYFFPAYLFHHHPSALGKLWVVIEIRAKRCLVCSYVHISKIIMRSQNHIVDKYRDGARLRQGWNEGNLKRCALLCRGDARAFWNPSYIPYYFLGGWIISQIFRERRYRTDKTNP